VPALVLLLTLRPLAHRPRPGAPGFIDGEPLTLDEFIFERFQVCVVELILELEGPVCQAAPLAQEGDHLIQHRDKVHAVSSGSIR